ncbi:MAG: DNA repair protein RecO [Pseudomonadota bacterium]
MTPRAAQVPAYVLHARAYGETSQIVELFTPAAGRLGVLAKGARARRRHGALQPFQPMLVSWSGRGELPVLSEWEATRPPFALRGEALLGGFYVNELLLRLCRRHDADPALFAAYGQVLHDLVTAGCLSSTLRRFDKALLGSLGVEPSWTRDCFGEAIRAEQWYRCAPQSLPRPIMGPGRAPWEVRGAALLALAVEPLVIPADCRAAVNGLFRALIAEQLGSTPLRTRALWQAMHGAPAQALQQSGD